MEVRSEEDDDRAGVRELHLLAFGQADEADLVDALRDDPSFIAELSIVAVEGGRVLGHVLLTEARLDTGPAVLALAPLGVRPDRQRRGIGTALVREAIRRARETSYGLVVVVGDPGFYWPLGFLPASPRGLRALWDVPAEAWMALTLPAYVPGTTGTVGYPPPFEARTRGLGSSNA